MTTRQYVFAFFSVLAVWLSVSLIPAFSATIHGTVTDSNGPVANITVGMSKCSSYPGVGCSLGSASTVTAVDGTYIFSDLALGAYRIVVPDNWEETSYTYQEELVQIIKEGQSVQTDFQLVLASTINGTIRRRDGGSLTAEEMDKIRLAVYPSLEAACDCIFSNYLCLSSVPSYSAITVSADGSYSIPGFSPGSYFVAARGDVTINYTPAWSAGVTSVSQCHLVGSVDISSPGSYINGIDFQLDSGATIQGTVCSSSQVSADELRVGLIINKPDTNEDACDFESFIFAVDVGEDGTYNVTGLPAGEYSLFVLSIKSSSGVNKEWLTGINTDSSPDCQQAEKIIVTSDEPEQVFDQRNFQVGTGGNISGAVFRDDGQVPVDTTYRVRFQESCTTAGDEPEAVTVSGQYTSPVLPVGDYYLALLTESGELIGWRTSSGISAADCADAVSVHIDENQTTGINFILKNQVILMPIYHMLLHNQDL